MLNVNYPKDDPTLLSQVSIVSFGIAALLLTYAIHKNRERAVGRVLVPVLVFGLAAAAAFSPWIVKNASEAVKFNEPVSIGILLNGVAYPVPADVKSVRSPEEIAAIEKKIAEESISASGKTTNEDLGRYFGYDE